MIISIAEHIKMKGRQLALQKQQEELQKKQPSTNRAQQVAVKPRKVLADS